MTMITIINCSQRQQTSTFSAADVLPSGRAQRLQSSIAQVRYSQILTLTLTITFAMIDFGYSAPWLLYSCETWYLNSCDMKRVEVAWNNAFRKIFNAFWYESVKPFQYYCSCLPVSILLPMKKLLFWKKMSCSGNMVLCDWQSVVMPVSLLWQRNFTSNLLTLSALVLRV